MKPSKRSADAAVAELLLDQLAQVRASIPGTLAGEDPEALHQLRVAVRRSRALLKAYPRVFTPAGHARFTAELAELQALTSPVRDYDVLLAAIDQFAATRPTLAEQAAALRKIAARRRAASRTRLTRRLRSKKLEQTLGDWQTLLTGLTESDGEERPEAAKPIGRVSARRIAKDHKRFVKLSSEAIETREPDRVHHARKRAKQLRYNLEFFGELTDPDTTHALIVQLKSTQDELGLYQDTVVRERLLRECADGAASDAALVAGAMIERALVERDAALSDFARRFSRLARKKSRSGVQKIFSA